MVGPLDAMEFGMGIAGPGLLGIAYVHDDVGGAMHDTHRVREGAHMLPHVKAFQCVYVFLAEPERTAPLAHAGKLRNEVGNVESRIEHRELLRAS